MSYRHVIVDVCNRCLQTYEKGTAHVCGVIPDDGLDSMHIIDTFNQTVERVEVMATILNAQDMTCKERSEKVRQEVAVSQFDLRFELRALNNRMDAIVSLVVTARDNIEAIQRDINELRYRVRTPPSAMPIPTLKKRGGTK